MNEFEKKILDAIGTKNLTLQEIADQLGIDKSEVWQNGLNRMIGAGTIEQIRSDRYTSFRVRARGTTSIQSLSQGTDLKDKENMVGMVRRAQTRTEIPPYPEDPEEVVTAAKGIDYVMSIREASKFISIYAPYDWESVEGRKIRNWPKLLHVWKSRQKPDEYIQAVNEAKRRAAGLPPVDPAELQYEYYEDAQGRKWRKRPDEDEWESVPETITFSDGTTALKGVV